MRSPPSDRRWPRPLTCALLVAYAAVLVLPRGFSAAGGSTLFFAYLLSLPLVLLGLAILGLVGAFGLRARAPDRRARARRRVATAGIGISSVLLAVAVSKLLPVPLPSGSHLSAFDRVAWHAPDAAEFVKGDVTPRQKMLGDIVDHVLPGRDRAAIELALGPGDPTELGADGHALVYRLGPPRDTPFSLDSEWLVVRLDAQGRFERYMIAIY